MAFEIPGWIIPWNGRPLLAYGPEALALGRPLFGPPVYLYPGYKLWGKPEYLVPHTVVDDHGQEFEVPEVYTWLETHGDLYPRSDVFGWPAGGGAERGVVVKALDLTDLAVFAAAGPAAGPFTRLALAVEAPAERDAYALAPAAPLVPLLARALPSYRLSPGVLPLAAAERGAGLKGGAVGAAILNQLLTSRRRGEWRLTYAELDQMTRDWE